MSDLYAPIAAGVAILVAAVLIGAPATRKFIQVQEARRELREGSPGALRMLRGWSLIAVWLLGTWFFGTVIGDWWQGGDLGGAVERAGDRLRVVLEIAAILMESDQ